MFTIFNYQLQLTQFFGKQKEVSLFEGSALIMVTL